MTHLYTLTGNLLAETTAMYGSVGWGATHRAREEFFQVGGKGINVAKMAKRLGVDSTAVCFPGGFTGDRCLRWLETQRFAVAPFRQEAETRAGWVVRSGKSETTFLGPDRAIDEEPWLAAMDFLAQKIQPGDMLAICGSLPGWRPALANPFEALLKRIRGKAFVAIDTYGAALGDILRHPVDLVKINRKEFQSLLPGGANNRPLEETFPPIGDKYRSAKRWVITDGGGDVLAWDEDRSILRQTPPVVKVVSPVGCGDVLLAGLMKGLFAEHLSLDNALKGTMSLAAANAASSGVADFRFQ